MTSAGTPPRADRAGDPIPTGRRPLDDAAGVDTRPGLMHRARMLSWAGPEEPAVTVRDLVGVHAALRSGVGPVEALATVAGGPLARVAAAARLGRPLGDLAATVPEEGGAQLLVRALAVAERAGVGHGVGAEQALAAIRQSEATRRMLAVKTAQARGTATLLMMLPVAGWVLLVGLDPATLRYTLTPLGMVTGTLSICLMAAGRVWTRHIVTRAAHAADAIDPLQGPPPSGTAAVGPGDVPTPGGPASRLAPRLLSRFALRSCPGRRRADRLAGGGTAEVVELLALALESGLSTADAVGVVAEVGPPAAAPDLRVAGRRLAAGWAPDRAFGRTRLELIGDVLAAVDRWGAPAAPPLRGLAGDLRADRGSAAEEAAERTQILLVFPTTLLTLPAFTLAVVPPLVWVGFAS